jgi:CspA family cold shock protein
MAQKYRGTVKFWRTDKGWGGVVSADLPADVWVHFSVIEGSGFKMLEQGQPVEFECVKQQQDSWQYVATRLRIL